MAVTREEILRVAELARLDLDEGDIDDLTARMNEILEHVDRMRETAPSGPSETSGATSAELVLAADVQGDMLSADEALRNAPDSARGHFRVPPSLPDSS